MSESENEPDGIRDEDLPEDLQPGEENPLAEGITEEELREDETLDRDDLDLRGGRGPEESDAPDEDGASRGEEDED